VKRHPTVRAFLLRLLRRRLMAAFRVLGGPRSYTVARSAAVRRMSHIGRASSVCGREFPKSQEG